MHFRNLSYTWHDRWPGDLHSYETYTLRAERKYTCCRVLERESDHKMLLLNICEVRQ